MLRKLIFQDKNNLLNNKKFSEEFEYVVNPVEVPKVAFGSGKARELCPQKGTDKFTHTFTLEYISNVNSTTYYPKDAECLLICPPGYGGLARKEPRFKSTIDSTPGPAEITLTAFPTPVKQNSMPFNSSTEKSREPLFATPGPGTYNITTKRDRRIKFDCSFGGRKKLHPAVDIKCGLYNVDLCGICQQHPEGDYWHYRNKEFLCRQCYAKEKKEHAVHKRWHIKEFRRIRDCSFMHEHDFTYAAYLKMDPKEAIKMLVHEAYFVEYFP